MTAELRKSIYSWRYSLEKHGDKEKCIPYQLQQLFAELQMGRQDHVETKGLTGSFGWTVADCCQQQDIQEFIQVFFA